MGSFESGTPTARRGAWLAASCVGSSSQYITVSGALRDAGTEVAILREGRVVQYDTPAAILARPANAFVEEFVGQDRALKRLSLYTVESRMGPLASVADDAPRLRADGTLRDALSALLGARSELALVQDSSGAALGTLRLDDVHAAAAEL